MRNCGSTRFDHTNTEKFIKMDNSIFEMLKRYVDAFEVQDAEQLALKNEAMELIRQKEELIDEEFQALKEATEGCGNYK